MFDVMSEISWIAVAAATVALTVLAGLYFGAVVPKLYLAALGREDQPAPEAGALTYAGPLVCNLGMVIASSVLMAALGIDTMGDAVLFGLIVGLGYLVPMTFTIAINPNFPRPLYYGLVNAPYFVFGSLMTAVIIELI